MKIIRWYFKNNYEDYKVLYQDKTYILVQNINTKRYSFGINRDFGSFYGFPINQSCLSKNECKERLKQFIKIDKKYNNVNCTIDTYTNMIKALEV